MLKGSFIDRNGSKWSLKGFDYQTYFEFLVSPDNENIDLDTYSSTESYHMLLKPTNIVYAGVKGSHNLHEEFSNLAMMLFWLKSICTKDNEEGYYEIGFEESHFSSLKKYSALCLGNNQVISTKMGTLVECSFRGNYFGEVYLKSEDRVEKLPWIDEKYTLQYKNTLIQKQEVFSTGVLNTFRTFEEILESNPDKNYSYILSKDLKIVDKENFEDVMSKFNLEEAFAVDTETDGLLIDFKRRDKLVGLILCSNEDTAYYFPFRHEEFENLCEEDEISDFFEKNFKELLEKGKGIYQNGVFDWKVLYSEGINARIYFDTLLAMRLTLWNEDETLGLGLKALAKRFLGHDSLELDDLVVGGWSGDVSFRQVPKELVRLYGCMDGINTYAIYKYILKENLLEYYNATRVFKLECKFSQVVGYQEYYGHHVDIDNLPTIREVLEKERKDLYDEMKSLVGGMDFNPASPKELQSVLFKVLGLKPVNYTASKQPSTDKDSLKVLAKQHKFPALLLKYRDLSAQINNFMNKIDQIATKDGFMFSSVQQVLNTGRLSVSSPNYQSYAPSVKRYITPREGFYMFDFDYSAVEYRIMSSMSREDTLIEKFFDPDTDIHTYQASRMFGIPMLYVSHQQRGQSKGVSFGLMYGMQSQSLGGTIFGKESPENTAKAENLMKLFFKGQEKVKAFFDDAQAKSYQQGWSDTYIGRRRYFNKDKFNAHKIMRMGANHRIQGTAADLFKLAMNRIFEMLQEEGWMDKVLITFFVHDEAVLEVHKSIDPAILMGKIMDCTRLKIKNWCPLTNECGFGDNWYEAKSGETPLPVQDIIISNFGKSGLDWWDGDIRKLVDFQVGEIHKWQLSRVVDFLKDPSNHSKEVYAPVLKQGQSLYKSILKGDLRGINPVISAEGFEFDGEKPINNFKGLVKLMGIEDLYEKACIKEEADVVVESEKVPTPIKEVKEKDSSVEDMISLFGVYRVFEPKEALWLLYPEDWLDSNQAVVFMQQVENIFKGFKGDIPVYFYSNKDGSVLEPEENGLSSAGVLKLTKLVRMLWGV